jgi:hypothetical protein
LNAHAQYSPENKEAFRLANEKAVRIANDLALSVKAKESKWQLTNAFEGSTGYPLEGPRHLEFVKQQNWHAGSLRLEVRIYIYESSEQASKMQKQHNEWSSVSSSSPLKDVGEEAYYISHSDFSWISARRGAVVVAVYGPPGQLTPEALSTLLYRY